jgi:hypothetical protein
MKKPDYTVIQRIGNKSAIKLPGSKRQYKVLCNLCNQSTDIVYTQKDEAVSAATINSNRECKLCNKK